MGEIIFMSLNDLDYDKLFSHQLSDYELQQITNELFDISNRLKMQMDKGLDPSTFDKANAAYLAIENSKQLLESL